MLSLYADKAALPKVVTVADIARMEGREQHSTERASTFPPPLGQSAYPQGKPRAGRWPSTAREVRLVTHLEALQGMGGALAQRRKAIQSRT